MASRRPITDYELLGIIENDLSDMECLSGDEDDLGWSPDSEDSGDSENEHEKNDCSHRKTCQTHFHQGM
ncbi:hypothetical protein JTB14_005626 [Gonioctena quinquepunctata]|nr:hypothetical protein JTB14_005626 [Gonioctena quinquepunctata]